MKNRRGLKYQERNDLIFTLTKRFVQLSCHICLQMFSAREDKNRHIEIVHYKRKDKQFQCYQCNQIVYSKQAHTECQHNE